MVDQSSIFWELHSRLSAVQGGIPKSQDIIADFSLGLYLVFSFYYCFRLWVKILIIIIAVSVSFYIIRLKNLTTEMKTILKQERTFVRSSLFTEEKIRCKIKRRGDIKSSYRIIVYS